MELSLPPAPTPFSKSSRPYNIHMHFGPPTLRHGHEVQTHRVGCLRGCASYCDVSAPRQEQLKFASCAGGGLEVPLLFAFHLKPIGTCEYTYIFMCIIHVILSVNKNRVFATPVNYWRRAGQTKWRTRHADRHNSLALQRKIGVIYEGKAVFRR